MLSKILTAIFLVGGTSALYAGPVYNCGGASACNGNLYAVWVVSQTATSYVLEVSIQATTSYTGSVVDSIDGLAITPDHPTSLTAASLLSTPLGNWTLQNGGLSASGCQGGGFGFVCAQAPGGAHLFSFSMGARSPNTLDWQFQINGSPPSIGDTVNLKYHYDHFGSIGVSDSGFHVGIQCIGNSGCIGVSRNNIQTVINDIQSVPEPVTSGLVGSGLIGFYFLRRRLQGSL